MGTKYKDITNQTFGRLNVIERVENDKHGFAVWRCRCECGVEKPVLGTSLRSGNTTSCGCRMREVSAAGCVGRSHGNTWGTLNRGVKRRVVKKTRTGAPVRSMRFIDLTGRVFDRLTVIELDERSANSYWRCRCSCGVEKPVKGNHLREGTIRSCGCRAIESRTKHGHAIGRISPTYSSWKSMIARCLRLNATGYARYGGAGVKVCPEWITFSGFLSAMGERLPNTTLGRILDLGNYEPGNVVYMTDVEQKLAQRNKRALLKWAAR